jgi:hypothetical protein
MQAIPCQWRIRFFVIAGILAGSVAARADEALVYDLASLDAPPVAGKHNARPKFPSPKGSAKPPFGIEVDFVVGIDGLTHETRTVGEPHEGFDAAAVGAVDNWHFTPGQRHGQPVATRIRKEVFVDPDSEDSSRTRMTNIRPKKDDSTLPPPFLLGDHTVFPFAALQSGQNGRVVV